MTTQELIDKLQELDVSGECEVYINTGSINLLEVDNVEYYSGQGIIIIE